MSGWPQRRAPGSGGGGELPRGEPGVLPAEQVPRQGAAALPHLDRCLGQFEDFCIVTESIRKGIPVNVKVETPVI